MNDGVREGLYAELHCDNAEEFLDLLTPHRFGPLWKRGNEEGWMFRGQPDAAKDLTPSAHRLVPYGIQPFTRFKPGQLAESAYTLKAQIDNEEAFVLRFASDASIAGFEIPGDRPELRTREHAVREHTGHDFPPLRQRWMYALAQHYRVPTRLLDWTMKPLVAAYFPAREVAETVMKGEKDSAERLAVWAASRPFVETKTTDWNPGPEIITVPTTSNPNLHAQQGLFTLVRYRAGITIRGSRWRARGRRREVGISANPPPIDALFRKPPPEHEADTAEPVMFKITLPVGEAPALLHYLWLHGVSASTVFPALGSITDAMLESSYWERGRRPPSGGNG